MSHHLDSPQARQDPRLNITDQYVFDDADGTAFVMNVRTSLAGDTVPDGFHPEGRYEFKVHLDDAPRENLTFRWVFGPRAGDRQEYRVIRLSGNAAADDDAAGVEIIRGETGRPVAGPGGLRAWSGRALDPFFLDLDQLAAVDDLVQHGKDANITRFADGQATNTFAGSAVHSIVLRVPHTDEHLFHGRVVRVWSRAQLATDSGGWRQVGRAALPMIWPIFRDAGSESSSRANETHPADDWANYGESIRAAITSSVQRLGTSDRATAYAQEVAERIIPDSLPYQIGTPAIFGFADFNGRRLGDNAPEVMFSLATNSAVGTGITGPATEGTRSEDFPYVVPA